MQENQFIPSSTPTENNENTNQPLSQPAPVSSTVLPPEPKKPKKIWLLVAGLLLIIGGAAAYWLTKSSPAKLSVNPNKTSAGINLATNEKPGSSKNLSSVNLAVGYVKYDAAKLKVIQPEATTLSKLSTVQAPAAVSNYSSVAFFQVNKDTYDQQLVMYDFGKKTFYLVDEERDLVHNFYNPVILSDHYVAYYLYTQKDPVTIRGSVELVDLNNLEKTSLFDDTGANLPQSACCAVSPDGLHLAMALPVNKLVVYTAGQSGIKTLNPDVKFTPVSQGNDNDSYAQAARAYGYPRLTWEDNDTVLLASSAPMSYTVNSQGTFIHPAKNSLATLDLKTGKMTTLPGTDQYYISWLGISSDKKIVFTSFDQNTDLSGGPATGKAAVYIIDEAGSTPKAIAGLSHEMLGSLVLDSASNKLYLQDSPSSSVQVLNIADGSLGKSIDAQGSLVEGVYSATELVSGNRDATLPSTQLNLLDLTTGQLTTIY